MTLVFRSGSINALVSLANVFNVFYVPDMVLSIQDSKMNRALSLSKRDLEEVGETDV